jgi:hypothetical protein
MRKNSVIVFDVKKMQPGCVLLQAAMGGDTALFNKYFGGRSDLWLVAPTPDMKRYQTTEEELEKLVSMMDEVHGVNSGHGSSGPR